MKFLIEYFNKKYILKSITIHLTFLSTFAINTFSSYLDHRNQNAKRKYSENDKILRFIEIDKKKIKKINEDGIKKNDNNKNKQYIIEKITPPGALMESQKDSIATIEKQNSDYEKISEKEELKDNKKLNLLDIENSHFSDSSQSNLDKSSVSINIAPSDVEIISKNIQIQWERATLNTKIKNLKIMISVEYNIDGTLKNIEYMNYQNNSNYKILSMIAEDVLKRTSPIKNLNPSNYSKWTKIQFSFEIK